MADEQDTIDLLDSVEGEISFFRAAIRSRPVGIHRHFHVLGMQNSILKDTGHLVPIDDIWKKLRNCYDIDALDAIDIEAEGYDVQNTNPNVTGPVRTPSPSANLARHPYFREEFTLPFDEAFEALIAQRRMRTSASIPSSSPAPSPIAESKSYKMKRRSRTKIDMAGLVGGDSDSSALTQESGDEGVVGTPRGSVVTATDGGATDNAEDDDAETRELSLAPSAASPKPPRGRTKPIKKGAGRGRGGASGTSRSTKKRKRGL